MPECCTVLSKSGEIHIESLVTLDSQRDCLSSAEHDSLFHFFLLVLDKTWKQRKTAEACQYSVSRLPCSVKIWGPHEELRFWMQQRASMGLLSSSQHPNTSVKKQDYLRRFHDVVAYNTDISNMLGIFTQSRQAFAIYKKHCKHQCF